MQSHRCSPLWLRLLPPGLRGFETYLCRVYQQLIPLHSQVERSGGRPSDGLKNIRVLMPGTCESYFMLQKGLCRCDYANDLEGGGGAWVIPGGP